MKKNLISIITVVFNAEKTIENTILSVINQNYDNIEYIVIDGQSTDNTLKIIQKYSKKINYWISEPDTGIYNAMNKGTKKATGDYIFFLNADDTLYNNETISLIVKEIGNEDIGLIYGKVDRCFKNSSNSVFDVQFSEKKLKKGIMPSHQAIFVKKELFEKFGYFNEKYKSASDLDFLCKIFLKNINIKKVDFLISVFSVSGYSYSENKGLLETLTIIKTYFGNLAYVCSLFKFIPIIIFRFIANKIGFMNFYRLKIYPILLKTR